MSAAFSLGVGVRAVRKLLQDFRAALRERDLCLHSSTRNGRCSPRDKIHIITKALVQLVQTFFFPKKKLKMGNARRCCPCSRKWRLWRCCSFSSSSSSASLPCQETLPRSPASTSPTGSSLEQAPRPTRWKGLLRKMEESPAFGTLSLIKVTLMTNLPRIFQQTNTIITRDDYTAYADACFKSFGDRVKHWITVNEPNIETIGSFDSGLLPPRRCSYPFGVNCTGGNSTMEPYIAAHHLLLAHASAVSLYRDKYQATQRGQIGITLLGWWHEPATKASRDAAAATRMNDFHIGWFMHPLVYGDYPPVMRRRVGARLPYLTAEQSKNLSGSFDFVGFNHYLVVRAQSDERAFDRKQRDYYNDAAAIANPFKDIQEGHLESAPWALGKLLDHLRLKYRNPPVMIHENGLADAPKTPSKIEFDDDYRSEYLQDYLEVLYLSIRNGSDARGYFVWSFLDVFELLFGYASRFGLCGVDMNAVERTRYMRNSARWYSSFLKGGELRPASPASGKGYGVA